MQVLNHQEVQGWWGGGVEVVCVCASFLLVGGQTQDVPPLFCSELTVSAVLCRRSAQAHQRSHSPMGCLYHPEDCGYWLIYSGSKPVFVKESVSAVRSWLYYLCLRISPADQPGSWTEQGRVDWPCAGLCVWSGCLLPSCFVIFPCAFSFIVPAPMTLLHPTVINCLLFFNPLCLSLSCSFQLRPPVLETLFFLK